MALGLSASTAQADVSGWAYLGGGASNLKRVDGAETSPLLQAEAGIGTSPEYPVIVGGVVRMLTHFGAGTDWALMERTATRGFVNGEWGLALDLGAYQRWWGPDSTGFIGSLVGGLPWGVNVALNGSVASADERMLAISIGIDWARLTAYRSSGQDWWPNYRLPLREN